MDYVVEEETTLPAEKTELNNSESTEKFQKFIHELFEKNGVLNDLRAYLRGHIVDVLKSAETGNPTTCQKHFTQRLELTFQAMNALIAEYLLRLEFSYSLSVFTSEIPLSNMVFQFTRSLLKTMDSSLSGLRFDENDIWSVLNYLGIQCDSDHATKIVESYNSQNDLPLLCCILKSVPMYKQESINLEQDHISEECLSSSIKSGDTFEIKSCHKDIKYTCKHYTVCKSCQNRVLRLKEKYKGEKTKLDESQNTSDTNVYNVETFMKNIDILEQSIIDEMFQELKSVYEAEVNMIREDKEKKIRHSIASHAVQLQKHRELLEETFKTRQDDFDKSVQHRKQFLWNLARELRAQRRRLAQAQDRLVRDELRLASEEKNLKIQMKSAEQTLRKRGEEMRNQITEEMTILQQHLENIKHERDNLDKDKIEFENYKKIVGKKENEMKLHYELLNNEITVLKKRIEVNGKCFVERGTATDVFLMNNENVGSCDRDFKVKNVINDLKKRKNVNFSQHNLEDTTNRHSTITNDSEVETRNTQQDIIKHLKDENERLKTFSRQQSEHIDRLSSEHIRSQADTHRLRPKTAPSVVCHSYIPQSRINQCAGEHSTYAGIQQRVLFPGDAIPFIGVVGDQRHEDRRRRMLSQWRIPTPSCLRPPTPHMIYTEPDKCNFIRTENNPIIRQMDAPAPAANSNIKDTNDSESSEKAPIAKQLSPINNKTRQKSPKSVLREAKEKLKNKPFKQQLTLPRDISPSATLREAKLRLRKLEIEAEAVEKSYLDFRKRQTGLRGENKDRTNNTIAEVDTKFDIKQSKLKYSHIYKPGESYIASGKPLYKEPREMMKKDFDKYFREYQKIGDAPINFRNMNTVIEKLKPISESYHNIDKKNSDINKNYLETPMIEFRKLYQSSKSKRATPRASNTIIHGYEIEHTESIQKINSNKHTGLETKQSDDINNFNLEADINLTSKIEIVNDKEIEKSETEEVNDNRNRIELDIIQVISPSSEPSIQDKTDTDMINETLQNFEQNVKTNINSVELESKANIEIDTLITDQIDTSKENIDTPLLCNDENSEDIDNKNLLIVEVENIHETIKTESNQNLLVVVESSIDSNELVLTEADNKISTQMTIIVSPKQDNNNLSISSPKIEKLTEKDTLNAIYRSLEDKLSSPEIESPNEKSISEVEKEYNDDFSADVDYYNSQSEYGKNSPISLPKTSEDENFWDS